MNKQFSIAGEHGAMCGAHANNGTEQLFGGRLTDERLIVELMRVARSLWPRKTAHELALRAKVSTRAAEKWLALECGMSGEQIASLIRSEDGFRFLEAIIGDHRPYWWKAFRRRTKRQLLRDELKRIQHELDLEDAAD
jgi:hypothetical protein